MKRKTKEKKTDSLSSKFSSCSSVYEQHLSGSYKGPTPLPAPPGLCPPAPPRRRTPLPCGKPGSLMQQQGSLWQSWKASSQQGSQPPSGCKPLLWSGSGEGGRKAAAPHLAGLVCAQNSRCHCQRCPCLCTRTLARFREGALRTRSGLDSSAPAVVRRAAGGRVW